MRAKTPTRIGQPAAKGHGADREGRINACWLRFWKTVYPNIPPPTEVQSLPSAERGVRSAESNVQSPRSTAHSPQPPSIRDSGLRAQDSGRRLPAAVGFLSRFLCAGFALALLVTGCAGPHPLKGGKATTTHSQAGLIQQTVAQGENASQPSKQDQETIKVRSYTFPAATRIEQSPVPVAAPAVVRSADKNVRAPSRSQPCSEPSTLNSQPSTICEASTSYILSSPMPVVEREETRTRTELGAAQKDTARDPVAKLSSLKGIVWVGVGLFVFGLASLLYPPLKLVVASVTTSVALMLGGVALIVLPTMVVGNELLILGVVGLVVGAWFLAHRHGQLRGAVAATTASAPAPGAATGSPAGKTPATVPPSTGATSGQAKMESRG
jgi:hypothetical protein